MRRDSRNNMVVRSLSFLFCPIFPKTWCWRTSKPEMATVTENKQTRKQSLLFLNKGPGKKAAQQDRHILDKNSSIPTKYHRKICGSILTPSSKGQVGSHDVHPQKTPNFPTGVMSEKPKQGARIFHPLLSVNEDQMGILYSTSTL